MDEPLLAALQLGDAPFGVGGLVAEFGAQLGPDVEEGRLDQAHGARADLDASEVVAEGLFEPLGSHLRGSAAFNPAAIVGVGLPHLAPAVGGGHGLAAGGAADEASEGEFGVLFEPGRLHGLAVAAIEPLLDSRPGDGVDEGLVLALGLDPPFFRLRHSFVEGVAEESPEFLVADGTAFLGQQAQGGQAPQDVGRGVARGDGFEALAHQLAAPAVVDDDFAAFGGAVVAKAQGCRPGPEAAGDGFFHAGGDLLGSQLVVELVEDGKDAFDGPARRGVLERLRGGTELGSGFAQELLEGSVDVDVPGESAGVVDDDEVHGARPQIFQHAAERRPVRRFGALSLFAVDGLDGPAVAGTVLAAGFLLDVEGQVGDLFL